MAEETGTREWGRGPRGHKSAARCCADGHPDALGEGGQAGVPLQGQRAAPYPFWGVKAGGRVSVCGKNRRIIIKLGAGSAALWSDGTQK
jgi:hypothetical protein